LLVAREAAFRHAEGRPLREAVVNEIERAREEKTSARIYAPVPLDELDELPKRSRFLLAPYELAHLSDLIATPFPGCREAAAAFYPLRARLRILHRVRSELSAALDLAAAKTSRTLDAVSRDRATLKDPEEFRRWADLLLAHPDAERGPDGADRGAHVVVPDDYGDGEPLAIPVDVSMNLINNAQAYYRRAQRAERSALKTRLRRQALVSRIDKIASLAADVSLVEDLSTAKRLARRAEEEGAEVKSKRWQEPEADFGESGQGSILRVADPIDETESGADETPKRKVAAGVSTYVSSDGYEILVGRNASANDRLTHRIAAPCDWWLHAEGPGSHIVVRNPTRQQDPPQDTLDEAASLAAYFSTARGATKVNVRFTQVRHLRRPKGSSPGRVILRLTQTLLAEPLSPKKLFAEQRPSREDTDNEPPTRLD
jgi:predicted ribosome quality control (RQC) complex YloA/Tae2 family protein